MSNKKYHVQKKPFVVPTTDGKLIEEHFGNATDGNSDVSVAHMVAPPKWSEPYQTPKFDEFTYIIKGKNNLSLKVKPLFWKLDNRSKLKKIHAYNIPIHLTKIANI